MLKRERWKYTVTHHYKVENNEVDQESIERRKVRGLAASK